MPKGEEALLWSAVVFFAFLCGDSEYQGRGKLLPGMGA
jgi:hypothetical protein